MNNNGSGINVPKHSSRYLATKIDSYQAATIARKFFEQYHSGVEIKDMALKDGTWHIIVGVDFLFEKIKKIEIDAHTGRIIRYQ
ncbi:MAG TPA: hypothetical protein VD828_01250 [Candidatus Nitrosotenuis sp.]|nr:hypothetical protein [Candidatus Nitrosotenuis sp.]